MNAARIVIGSRISMEAIATFGLLTVMASLIFLPPVLALLVPFEVVGSARLQRGCHFPENR
jgi:hypothetical protein